MKPIYNTNQRKAASQNHIFSFNSSSVVQFYKQRFDFQIYFVFYNSGFEDTQRKRPIWFWSSL